MNLTLKAAFLLVITSAERAGGTTCSGDKLTLHALLARWLRGDLVFEFSISASGHITLCLNQSIDLAVFHEAEPAGHSVLWSTVLLWPTCSHPEERHLGLLILSETGILDGGHHNQGIEIGWIPWHATLPSCTLFRFCKTNIIPSSGMSVAGISKHLPSYS